MTTGSLLSRTIRIEEIKRGGMKRGSKTESTGPSALEWSTVGIHLGTASKRG